MARPIPAHTERRAFLETRLSFVLCLFGATLLAGSLGYRLLEGWPLPDSFYMTVITVSTVGFAEVRPLSSGGRFFTATLILVSVGVIAYSFGVITDYLIAGELQGYLRERRTRRLIATLNNHFIICGYGRMGKEVCQELRRQGRPFIVVDKKRESYLRANQDGFPALLADPGLDETLNECGIARAAGLAAVSDDDAKNLMVVISARGLNPKLAIVARVSAEDAPEKFIRAGADSTFLPYRTGGRRIAQMMARPEVVGFLEDILHDESSLGLMIENFTVAETSEVAGQTLEEARIRERTGAFVVGLKRRGEGIVPDLLPSTRFKPGDIVIALGHQSHLDELGRLLAG